MKRLALLLTVAAALAITAAAAGASHVYVSFCFSRYHAPRVFTFGCDGSTYARAFEWSRWNAHGAVGHGQLITTSARGKPAIATVRIWLSHPERCDDGSLYFTGAAIIRLRGRWYYRPGGPSGCPLPGR